MSTASFNGLLIISVIAVMAPVLAASVKRVKLPSLSWTSSPGSSSGRLSWPG
jgi:hypothetical protein